MPRTSLLVDLLPVACEVLTAHITIHTVTTTLHRRTNAAAPAHARLHDTVTTTAAAEVPASPTPQYGITTRTLTVRTRIERGRQDPQQRRTAWLQTLSDILTGATDPDRETRATVLSL